MGQRVSGSTRHQGRRKKNTVWFKWFGRRRHHAKRHRDLAANTKYGLVREVPEERFELDDANRQVLGLEKRPDPAS
jgi:hypothetical protein